MVSKWLVSIGVSKHQDGANQTSGARSFVSERGLKQVAGQAADGHGPSFAHF